jgi:hypothetical protein
MRPIVASELPDWFSSGLKASVDGGVMANTGSLLMWNLYRRDGTVIDQQPVGVKFLSGAALASGGCIQHGGWTDRTQPLSSGALDCIAASGLGHNQLWSGHPKAPGPISALGPSDHAALAKLESYMSDLS